MSWESMKEGAAVVVIFGLMWLGMFL